jgi:hypothetical protein
MLASAPSQHRCQEPLLSAQGKRVALSSPGSLILPSLEGKTARAHPGTKLPFLGLSRPLSRCRRTMRTTGRAWRPIPRQASRSLQRQPTLSAWAMSSTSACASTASGTSCPVRCSLAPYTPLPTCGVTHRATCAAVSLGALPRVAGMARWWRMASNLSCGLDQDCQEPFSGGLCFMRSLLGWSARQILHVASLLCTLPPEPLEKGGQITAKRQPLRSQGPS